MNETTSLPVLLAEQDRINQSFSPEAQPLVKVGMALGMLAAAEANTNTEAERDRWHYIATHDDLITDALNRRGLQEHLSEIGMPKAILIIDATNFKAVNDIYGHQRGDEIITATYETLKASLREGDVIARIGGDEFMVILDDDTPGVSPDHPMAHEYRQRRERGYDNINIAKARIAARVQELLDNNPDLKMVNFNLAVGGARWTGQTLPELISTADQESKEHKKDQHRNGGRYERSN